MLNPLNLITRAGHFALPDLFTANDPVVQNIDATALKVKAGTGAFVSGAVTIQTGLTTVLGFALTPVATATGPATGATEITNWALAITTGAVALQGYRLWTVTASVSGTMAFNYLAIGT